MRKPNNRVLVFLMAAFVVLLAVGLWMVLTSQPVKTHAQLRNAYYPFTVEIEVRDR